MKVTNMKSERTGAPVANQYVIRNETEGGYVDSFQSYDSLIAEIHEKKGVIYVDPKYSSYSSTTARYFNQFMRNAGHDIVTNNLVKLMRKAGKTEDKIYTRWTLILKSLN